MSHVAIEPAPRAVERAELEAAEARTEDRTARTEHREASAQLRALPCVSVPAEPVGRQAVQLQFDR